MWSLAWSPSNEWQLATGGCDGQLRLWDIRRAGPLHIFDQHDTQEARAAGVQAAEEQQGEAEIEEGLDQDAWGADAPQPLPPRDQDDQQPAAMQQAAAAMLRQRSGGTGSGRRAGREAGGGGGRSGRAAAVGGGSTAGSERMFLPERVTKYSTAHAGSITGALGGLASCCVVRVASWGGLQVYCA